MRKLLLATIISIIVVSLSSGISSADNSNSIMEKLAITSPGLLESILQNGQMVYIDNVKPGEPQYVTGIVLFNAPIETVFSTITDYDQYADHIPQTTDVKILQKNGNTWTVSYKIEFKFSIISERADYTLKQVLNPPNSVTWTRISGNLKDVNGSWHLISLDNGTRTIGFYRVYTDVGSISFLLKYLLKKQPTLGTAIATSSVLVYTKAIQKWVESVNKEQHAVINQ